jgi:hypothetical protein
MSFPMILVSMDYTDGEWKKMLTPSIPLSVLDDAANFAKEYLLDLSEYFPYCFIEGNCTSGTVEDMDSDCEPIEGQEWSWTLQLNGVNASYDDIVNFSKGDV